MKTSRKLDRQTASRVAGYSRECRPHWMRSLAVVAIASVVFGVLSGDVGADERTVGSGVVVNPIERGLSAVVKLYGAGLGREHGYGTGVLVSEDGRIVTTLSLLVRSGGLRVVVNDGRSFDATLARVDEYRQLALLKIDGSVLPHLTPTETGDLRIGDTVLAFGNWYKIAEGDEPVSVVRGVLSARVDLDARRLAQDFAYRGPVLVYDAITSNPGAPGGALLDGQGRFVGLIGRIVESSTMNTRLNYALPSEEVIAFLGDGSTSRAETARPATTGPAAATEPATTEPAASVADGGAAAKRDAVLQRPYVGIKLSKFGYRHVSPYVARVRSGSPAAAAGIEPDDLIIAIDGRRIGDAADYERVRKSLLPGQRVEFVVKRGERVVHLLLTVGGKP